MEFNLGCLYTLGCLVYYWSMVDFPKDTPLKKTDPSFSCSYQMPIVPHWERKLDAHPVSMILGSVAPVFFPPTIILWAFTPHGFQTQFLVQSNIPNSLNSSPIVQYSDISQFLASIDNVIENIAFLAILKLLFFFFITSDGFMRQSCACTSLYTLSMGVISSPQSPSWETQKEYMIYLHPPTY